MIYVFGSLLIISFMKHKDILLNKKRNLVLFLILSVCGIALGVVRMIYPYVPSIAYILEKYLK
ncbi:hypothetical protein [Herbinix luporum]|uniref:Putative membrane protein n=1 Tax=Herbinix luporum TaxID=1679721 RepID=A0A0K8J4F4_9FIRM|nr:hypothetical protein [Herbinix luporum]MDI9488399.1 hypothetical protein [Bacillota bacterium]CUH92551.1 putative membrane protein [Herbinix luporum]HHT56810.1 hypothetical protein [Herbinix luporum]